MNHEPPKKNTEPKKYKAVSKAKPFNVYLLVAVLVILITSAGLLLQQSGQVSSGKNESSLPMEVSVDEAASMRTEGITSG